MADDKGRLEIGPGGFYWRLPGPDGAWIALQPADVEGALSRFVAKRHNADAWHDAWAAADLLEIAFRNANNRLLDDATNGS